MGWNYKRPVTGNRNLYLDTKLHRQFRKEIIVQRVNRADQIIYKVNSNSLAMPSKFHIWKKIFFLFITSSASFVPSTRAFILAKAISLEVEVSSAKGEKPQSSVVPSCSEGIVSAASNIMSRISSAVSILGLSTSVTP